MSQQRCSNFQKSYLEQLNSSGDDPSIFEKLRKSSTTFVYNFFPDSDVRMSENSTYPKLSRLYYRTEASKCKYHISDSSYPNTFQLILLESLENCLQLFYRTLFQILQVHLSKTVGNQNWSRFLAAQLYHLVIFLTSKP